MNWLIPLFAVLGLGATVLAPILVAVFLPRVAETEAALETFRSAVQSVSTGGLALCTAAVTLATQGALKRVRRPVALRTQRQEAIAGELRRRRLLVSQEVRGPSPAAPPLPGPMRGK